ncbi:MAG TPA: GNAT family N-acetyltransferase [Ignavibacteria bacterium]|nr:GNAT family N-acetyltransferase [Ignavibacteria bacterium]
MKIIKATLAELEQTAKLFDDYRVFYDQEPDIEGALKFINERMKNNDSVIFIALDENNEGMGFAQLYPSFTSIGMKKMWVLNDLYVNIIHRHKKVAEGLIERSKELIRETGAAGMVLETQNENHPAQKLYYKTGWIKDDMHANFFWKTD